MNKNIITILTILVIFMIAIPAFAGSGKKAAEGAVFILVNNNHEEHALGGRSQNAHKGLSVAAQHSDVIREHEDTSDDTDDITDDGKDAGGDLGDIEDGGTKG